MLGSYLCSLVPSALFDCSRLFRLPVPISFTDLTIPYRVILVKCFSCEFLSLRKIRISILPIDKKTNTCYI